MLALIFGQSLFHYIEVYDGKYVEYFYGFKFFGRLNRWKFGGTFNFSF